MRQLLFTVLALLGLASPCLNTNVLAAEAAQGPPDFGIDTSGTLRNLSVRDATLGSRVPLAILNTTNHSFVSATTPVEASGAKGDSNGTTGNGTDDTAAIEACVAGGHICALRPGATYRIMSAIDIPANGGLIGDKTATLYCDPAGINNTSLALEDRYLQTGTCIKAEGPAPAPAGALANVVLKDFKINWGGGTNRCCQAVQAINLKGATIDGLEIYNLSAYGIRYASWQGGRIVNNYIHDGTNNTGAEYAGIQGDGDEVSVQESTDVLIAGNRISNMLISAAGFAAAGSYQPNAIKLVDGARIRVLGNSLDRTGQCIDGYLTDSVIANNTTDRCLVGGISLKHSNNNNVVANNTVANSGNWGIVVIGDAPDTAFNNLIANNVIKNVAVDDWTGFTNTMFDSGQSMCIFNWTNTKNNTYSGNSCDPGSAPGAAFNWRDSSAGDRNTWVDNVVVAEGSEGEWQPSGDGAGYNASINDAQQRIYGQVAAGDFIPLALANRASPAADGQAALMEFSSADQLGTRSVQIGDIDKPTTGAHCFTVRTSAGATPEERTFTCLGTVVGAPAGGTNGDMGAGTVNALGYYQDGVPIALPVFAGTPIPTLTFGGASTGLTMTAFPRSVTTGKEVFFVWNIDLSSKGSSTGLALFDGLPSPALNGMHSPCSVHLTNMTPGVGDGHISCLIVQGSTAVTLFKIVGGVVQQLTDADFTNTSVLRISGTYIAN